MDPDNAGVTAARGGWPYLDHFPQPGGPLQRVFLHSFPFRLGRDRAAHLVIYHPQVSKSHAEILAEDDLLFLHELGSTNGTFVNGRRISGRVPINDGDIIHLAGKEFRFGVDAEAAQHSRPNRTETAVLASGPPSVIKEIGFLNEMVGGRWVAALFQPILSLGDLEPVGYEALGRGQHSLLPSSPAPLFELAQQCRMETQLSRVFRQEALAAAQGLPRPHLLFLNVHPDEPASPEFQADLERLPGLLGPGQTIVLELHEELVAEMAALERLRAQTRELGIHLAHDDFGVGQARLAALAQVPVDYVKIDQSIVQGLPHSRALRELIRGLGQVCADLGTQVLAEGLETDEEVAACQELGCRLGQGYVFARPMPAGAIQAWVGGAFTGRG